MVIFLVKISTWLTTTHHVASPDRELRCGEAVIGDPGHEELDHSQYCGAGTLGHNQAKLAFTWYRLALFLYLLALLPLSPGLTMNLYRAFP